MKQEKYMRMALLEAKKALKLNEVPIGAIIVKDDIVIARGHNLRESKQNSLLHAEIIAINKACKKLNNFRLEDCELYVTVEPCLMCAGAIVLSRIKKVYYGAKDSKYGAVESVTKTFDVVSNHKVEYENEILQSECSKLISEFFCDLRKQKTNNKSCNSSKTSE